ncbi:MAG: diguanylate cyclase [Campylobacteraceae bacterium]|nr:diguanylate cyclase [Campylobacteraceae bacterium]
MSTMNEIIKESLSKLRAEHLILTPDNYTNIFCQVAKSKGVIIEDCQKVEKYIARLDSVLQNEAKRLKVQSIEELFSFFVAKLNRLNPQESTKIIQSLVLMSKRTLQALTLLHNKRARDLANASLERLDINQNHQSIELIKDKWFDFINEYDDTFLRKLDSFGYINKDDLQAAVNDILKILNKEPDETAIYRRLAPLIIATLVPSIASSMNDDLAAITNELRSSPEALASAAIQGDIRQFIKKRIELDKEEIKDKIGALDRLLDEINQKIVHLIKSSHSSSEEARTIKKDLNTINFSKDSFESIQARLVKIASSLENEAESLHDKMIANQNTMNKMYSRIKKLENALVAAKQESKEDFLTNVSTKRVLMSELEKAEEAYVRYKIDYSICFIDLDRFKNINDTYGHEAGDVILKTVGRILQKLARKVDVVGRYGGEEFVVILPSTSLEQAVVFAQKVRQAIEQFTFIYKKDRIVVTASCGISERKAHKSKEEAFEMADKMLYEAKEAGRNLVKPMVS